MRKYFINLEVTKKIAFLNWYLIYPTEEHMLVGTRVTFKPSPSCLLCLGTVPPNPFLEGKVPSPTMPVQDGSNKQVTRSNAQTRQQGHSCCMEPSCF